MPDQSTSMAPSSRFSTRYNLFANETSFHGFREINESRTWVQKAVWVAIMIGCTAMLAFHIQNQVRQYLSGGMVTKITQLTDDEPYPYPPIWIAFDDWYWLDIIKIESYQISYEELQMAKSYLTVQTFDSDSISPMEAKKKLEQRMDSFNVTGVSQFLTMLSLTTLNSIEELPQFRLHNIFESTGYALLDITKASALPYTKTLEAKFVLDMQKYADNAWTFKSLFKTNLNLTKGSKSIAHPYLYHLDAGQEIPLIPGQIYHLAADSKVYRKLRHCRTDAYEDLLYNEAMCKLECDIRVNISMRTFQPCMQLDVFPDLHLTQSYRSGSFASCQYGIMVNGSLEMREETTFRDLSSSELQQRDFASNECKKPCVRQCQRVSSSWSVTVSSLDHSPKHRGMNKSVTLLEVRIPDRESLIVFEEVHQYEWHDMVSDMGGLLGLWLGASMMSLFQMVHLCCWARDERSVTMVQSI